MRTLVITNLFPSKSEPTRGMYNFQQLKELSRYCDIRVLAPLPWAPFSCSRWKASREAPKSDSIAGIATRYPRYFMIPKIGRSLYGFFFALSLIRPILQMQKEFQFDIIYVPWVYPDGFGTYLLARIFKKPVVIGALGSDINVATRYFLRRKLIAYALKHCNAIIAVSNALAARICSLGITKEKTFTIPNGVNTELFKPLDKIQCRRTLTLPLEDTLILFVGNLVAIKGIQYLVEAFSEIAASSKPITLVLLGGGPLKDALIKQARDLGLSQNIQFIGPQQHDMIPLWMNAADIFCLPSLNEGMPNVLLEALACGKPVISTTVGGIPEIITSDRQGILVPPADSSALASALRQLLHSSGSSPSNTGIPAPMSWKRNAELLFNILTAVATSYQGSKQ